MSFYQQNLQAFMRLLQEQPQLFGDSKRQELIALIESLPDDLETLSLAIASWYETDDEIVDAQLEIMDDSSILAVDRIPGTNFGNVPKPNQQINKETLKNAIQQSVKKPPAKL
ncbi:MULTISPECIES: hypothetical protein [Planktothrix]|uniref:Uncharacterized protein n=1 Tax=Planktothrix rubescens CCAP 1459/22 TaxID=329571 RepID=A0A6J7ZU49_PLARU|nr:MULTISPECIES: hypothetical protein [Planktothrix]CAC5345933.1 conserved hypothetical protein [Planktothrix rubescens NIVA-CYA 18]CAD5951310.1 hypothetical protein PCC7821_02550 [Planktothrix rubescens NIVA-CYA 18]